MYFNNNNLIKIVITKTLKIMKKHFILALISAFILVQFTSCDKNDEPKPKEYSGIDVLEIGFADLSDNPVGYYIAYDTTVHKFVHTDTTNDYTIHVKLKYSGDSAFVIHSLNEVGDYLDINVKNVYVNIYNLINDMYIEIYDMDFNILYYIQYRHRADNFDIDSSELRSYVDNINNVVYYGRYVTDERSINTCISDFKDKIRNILKEETYTIKY